MLADPHHQRSLREMPSLRVMVSPASLRLPPGSQWPRRGWEAAECITSLFGHSMSRASRVPKQGCSCQLTNASGSISFALLCRVRNCPQDWPLALIHPVRSLRRATLPCGLRRHGATLVSLLLHARLSDSYRKDEDAPTRQQASSHQRRDSRSARTVISDGIGHEPLVKSGPKDARLALRFALASGS